MMPTTSWVVWLTMLSMELQLSPVRVFCLRDAKLAHATRPERTAALSPARGPAGLLRIRRPQSYTAPAGFSSPGPPGRHPRGNSKQATAPRITNPFSYQSKIRYVTEPTSSKLTQRNTYSQVLYHKPLVIATAPSSPSRASGPISHETRPPRHTSIVGQKVMNISILFRRRAAWGMLKGNVIVLRDTRRREGGSGIYVPPVELLLKVPRIQLPLPGRDR